MPVALLLKTILCVEVLIYLLIGRTAHALFGWPSWTIVAAVPTLWIAARVILFGFEFWLARRWGDPVPGPLRVSPAVLARCIAAEILAVMRSFSFVQAFPRLSAPWAFAGPVPGERSVVLLVHGFMCNGSVWRSMRRHLTTEGFDVEVVNLTPVFGPIAMTVPQLDDKIEAVCKARGIARLPVIAHSMGGLAIRAYMAIQGDARISRIVTIATPHHGTRMADLAHARNTREMRPGSSFLAALAAKETPARRAKFTCIFSYHDNLVTPQRSAVLPDAREVAFSGIGHVCLIHHPQIQRQVAVELRRPA